MKKFLVPIDAVTTAYYAIEAETEDEAFEKAEEIIDGEDFFDTYREKCDFAEVSVDHWMKLSTIEEV